MRGATPTSRTLALLRAKGWTADKVEQRLPIPIGKTNIPTTKDAFGFGDVLACHPQNGIMLVQCTSRGGMNARLWKVTRETKPDSPLANPIRTNLLAWIAAGGKFELWGWDIVTPGAWRRVKPGERGRARLRVVRLRNTLGGLIHEPVWDAPPGAMR